MKKIIILILFVPIFLASCNLPERSNESTEYVESANLTANINNTPIETTKVKEVMYSVSNKSLIMENGKLYGYLKFNFVQKLGIWDWYNQEVIKNGIRVSYAVNLNINMKPLMDTANSALIIADVSIVNPDGKEVSKNVNIGWSGFDQVAELYTSDYNKNIEICLQPTTVTIPSNSKIKISLKDSVSGKKFDDIFYSLDLLRNAEQGSSIKTIDKATVINSINGAKYSIKFELAEQNKRLLMDASKMNLYDIEYIIKYLKKPTNKRNVTIFDSFDHQNISPYLMFDVKADVDQTPCSDVAETALENIDGDWLKYVTKTKSFSVGNAYQYRTNRIISHDVSPANEYIRIFLQFPEERAARSDKEMKYFNGRYIVYQLKISKHKFRHLEEEGSVE